MHKLKRLLHVSGVLGLLAAAVAAAPAQASVKSECVVIGDAKLRDKDNPEIGMRLVGGEGKFTFDTLLIDCVADTNKDGVPEILANVGVTATGRYDNTMCGTGKALGTVVDVDNAPAKVHAAVLGKKFGIEFLEDQGVFKWHNEMATVKDIPLPKDDPESEEKWEWNFKDYSLAGALNLVPAYDKPLFPLPDITAGECRKAVGVNGSVLVHFDA